MVVHFLGLGADVWIDDVGGVAGVRAEGVGGWAGRTVVFSRAGCVGVAAVWVVCGGGDGVGVAAAEVLAGTSGAGVGVSGGVVLGGKAG
jgi:hypothetical protein